GPGGPARAHPCVRSRRSAMSGAIDSILVEKRVFEPAPGFEAAAAVSGMSDYQALREQARRDPDRFWGDAARELLVWRKPFTRVLDESDAPFYRWFDDGELNVSENCLDVHLHNGNADKPAIVSEADDGAARTLTSRELLGWRKPFTRVLDDSAAPSYRWFGDGELNVCQTCLDVHLHNGNADKPAIVFEADDGAVRTVTFRDLHARVCRIANGIASLGYRKGDRAILYMPMSIEAIACMQACARLGITHSVVFGGFSTKSLHQRIVDVQASLVITADEQMRGGRAIPLKAAVDEALAGPDTERVRQVIVYRRSGGHVDWQEGRDLWLHEIEGNQPDTCEPVPVEAEHPLFILYTSGSTGKPKGVQHS